jgi:hypothetical protein
MDKEQPTDVAPDWFVRILMISWLVLLGGRWIATPFIMFGDPSVAEAVSSADRGPLLRCYLVLLLLTLIVPALRFAKSLERWLEQKRTAPAKNERAV